MKTEKIYKTFAAFCKGENLIKGNIKSHCDGFVYCDLDDITIEKARKRETGLLINNTL